MSDDRVISLLEETAGALRTLQERIASMRALIDNIDTRLLELEMTYTNLAGRQENK